MTPEQKQRIEQIQERQEKRRHDVTRHGSYTMSTVTLGDIDFLLSLVKSQEAVSRVVPDPKKVEAGRSKKTQCPDCAEAARLAYSDATTPGFFNPKCARHQEQKAKQS